MTGWDMIYETLFSSRFSDILGYCRLCKTETLDFLGLLHFYPLSTTSFEIDGS